MSFSYQFKTMRIGKTYDSSAQLEMSAHEEEVTGEAEMDANGGNEQNNIIFSPNMVDERIKANLELLHTHISALTETMDRLIPGNLVREFTTAGTRELRHQSESPFTGATGTSRFPTVAPLTTGGYSPDTPSTWN